jgi:hypothetical protein
MREALERKGAGEAAILCGGRILVVKKEAAARLEASGAEFAFICDHQGTIVTIPADKRE